MKRFRRLRPTIRRRLTWAMVLWLVCQQLALAAYACAGLPGGVPLAAAAAMPTTAGRETAGMRMPGMDMAGMGSADTGMDTAGAGRRTGAPAPALCEGHCHPDHATQPDARAPSVPPAMVGMLAPPPVLPAMAQASSGNLRVRAERWHPPAPPPTLLYCSLLI